MSVIGERFVHVDHHRLDDRHAAPAGCLLAATSPAPESLQAHSSLGSRARLQAHTSLDKTGLQESEREAVRQALREEFMLSASEATDLAELARATAKGATDLLPFTSRINEHCDMPQKLRMVEYMWRVAYADGTLSAYERHIMWRIADLLHVPQGAYVNARMRARQRAGLA